MICVYLLLLSFFTLGAVFLNVGDTLYKYRVTSEKHCRKLNNTSGKLVFN